MTSGIASLRQLLVRPVPASGHRCELCGVPLTDGHRHLVDVRVRRLVCACGACVALRQAAASAATDAPALRPVPQRYVHRPAMIIPSEQWDALEVPVDLAFFFVNSAAGRPVACYPGPAGAVESALTLDAWWSLVAANPWIGTLAADVEALLVRRSGDAYQCFIVPIDRCYELAGRIRRAWTGIGGGDEVRAIVDRFFGEVAVLGRGPS